MAKDIKKFLFTKNILFASALWVFYIFVSYLLGLGFNILGNGGEILWWVKYITQIALGVYYIELMERRQKGLGYISCVVFICLAYFLGFDLVSGLRKIYSYF